MKNRGVLYCASNRKFYLDECIFSAKTFKKYNPKIPITLYTNLKVPKNNCFDDVIIDDEELTPLLYKAKALNSFPYEQTLFIDSDTKITGQLGELFAFLTTYDMALAKRIKANWSQPIKFIDYEDPSSFNTGIIAYADNTKTRDFFRQWLDEVEKEDKLHSYYPTTCDQQSFNHLVFNCKLEEKTGVNILVLPNRIYNSRHIYRQLIKDGLVDEVKIWHTHGLNISFIGRVKNKFRSFFR